MSDYTKATDFAAKDALATGKPLKIVKGTELDDEFNSIQTAVNSKADAAGSTGQNFSTNNLTVAGSVSLSDNGLAGAVKAFANIDGSGDAVNAGSNVDSVTSASAGEYTITMTNAVTDTNYTVIANGQGKENGPSAYSDEDRLYCPCPVIISTTQFKVFTGGAAGSSNPEYNPTDVYAIHVAVIR